LPIQWLVLENDPNNPHERLTGVQDVRHVAKISAAVYTWQPSAKDLKNRAAPVTVFRYPPPLP
jgi:hypothetical protein